MPRRSGLADAIHYLKLSFAKRLRSQRSPEKSGGFWQKRYYDRNVRSYREFVVKLRYLHRNPVKRGLVSNLEDWKWSNYRHYRFREIAIVEIESEWTARDREQKERWRSASNFPSPRLGPKIGANLGHQCKPNSGRECECRLYNLFGSDVASIGMHDSHSRIDERTFRQLERARF